MLDIKEINAITDLEVAKKALQDANTEFEAFKKSVAEEAKKLASNSSAIIREPLAFKYKGKTKKFLFPKFNIGNEIYVADDIIKAVESGTKDSSLDAKIDVAIKSELIVDLQNS